MSRRDTYGGADSFEAACEDVARGWEKLPKIARAFTWALLWLVLLLLLLMSGCTASFTTWALT